MRTADLATTGDARSARDRLAATGGGSHPTHEGMRTFSRTAPGEDIIADRLGGHNRWPLTDESVAPVPEAVLAGPRNQPTTRSAAASPLRTQSGTPTPR